MRLWIAQASTSWSSMIHRGGMGSVAVHFLEENRPSVVRVVLADFPPKIVNCRRVERGVEDDGRIAGVRVEVQLSAALAEFDKQFQHLRPAADDEVIARNRVRRIP